MAQLERVYIAAHGRDDEATKLGFRWLAQQAKTQGGGTLFVPGLRTLDSLSNVFSAPGSVRNAKHFTLDGTRIGVATKLVGRAVGPVLALWVDDDLLRQIEDRGQPTAICAIPWHRDGINQWLHAHGPTDLRTQEAPTKLEIGNAVVRVALELLTASVNLGTGLGHPSDRDHAVETLLALKQAGEAFRADEVRAYAVSHGWSAKAGQELADIAQKVNDGKRLKRGHFKIGADQLKYWRELAAAKEEP